MRVTYNESVKEKLSHDSHLLWRIGLLISSLIFLMSSFHLSLVYGETVEGKKDVSLLASLLEEAFNVNPEIMAARERMDEVKARVPVAGSLPDPEVDLEGSNVGRRRITLGEEPESMIGIKISQELPLAGKRGIRKRITQLEMEQAKQALQRTERKVTANLKEAYYDLQVACKAEEIIEKNKDLLQTLAKTAESRYAVGQGLQQDVLKAQVEISTLIQRLIPLEQQKRTAKAAINALLNRPADSPLGKHGDIVKETSSINYDQLGDLALRNSPMVLTSEIAVKARESNLELARKEYYPDVKIGVSYQNRGRVDEVYGLNFMIPLPVYYKSKQNYLVQEAASGLKAANYELQAVKQDMLFRLNEQVYALKASQKVIELLEKGTIPQASLTLESAMAAYRVGKVDFLTLLNNLLTLFNLELEYYQELINYNKSLARMEEVAGLSLKN